MNRFRFASLGSGSRGNATLVQSTSTTLLIDCGFAAREMTARCEPLGIDPASIDAILVTHEHGDHMKGVGATSRRYDIPVWMTAGTWHAADFGKLEKLAFIDSHSESFVVGDIDVTPVAVPHDAREPVQYLFTHASKRIGLLTDLGSITPHVCNAYDDLDALLLEANHDPQMLRDGPYPPSLQARVGGNYGHLSNHQSANLLSSIRHDRLEHLVAAHLSEKNNSEALAVDTLRAVSEHVNDRLTVLCQDRPSNWFELTFF